MLTITLCKQLWQSACFRIPKRTVKLISIYKHLFQKEREKILNRRKSLSECNFLVAETQKKIKYFDTADILIYLFSHVATTSFHLRGNISN